MATRILFRSILNAKQSLSSAISRSYTSFSVKTPPFSFDNLRPLVAAAANFGHLSLTAATVRGYATRQTTSSLNDSSPNWSNRPPKETILLDGCDFEHWLVVMEKPEGDLTRDEIIDSYIKTLAQVVGSYEDARYKIYSVSTRHYFAFGALVSEELSYKLKELPNVRWVLPDSYLDVKNKDYGGEPFINGVAVPYDPKYHEEWVRNNARANERNRRNDRPRNFDRSRTFDQRRENMRQNRMGYQNQGPGMGGPQGNMGGPQGNMGGPQGSMGGPQGSMGGPQNMGGPQGSMGGPQNMGVPHGYMGGPQGSMGGPQSNMGGPQGSMGGPQNMGGPQRHMGGPQGPQSNMGGPQGPQSNMGSPQGPQSNMGGPQGPQSNMGGPANMPGGPGNNVGMQHGNNGGQPNMRAQQPNNMAGAHASNGMDYQQSNGPNYQSYESGQGPNKDYQHNSYNPNTGGGNTYQTQDMPGRDMPGPPNYQ